VNVRYRAVSCSNQTLKVGGPAYGRDGSEVCFRTSQRLIVHPRTDATNSGKRSTTNNVTSHNLFIAGMASTPFHSAFLLLPVRIVRANGTSERRPPHLSIRLKYKHCAVVTQVPAMSDQHDLRRCEHYPEHSSGTPIRRSYGPLFSTASLSFRLSTHLATSEGNSERSRFRHIGPVKRACDNYGPSNSERAGFSGSDLLSFRRRPWCSAV
jgi:hypothetical protein